MLKPKALRRLSETEIAERMRTYTNKAARALDEVRALQAEQKRREREADKAAERIEWPCAECGLLGTRRDLDSHGKESGHAVWPKSRFS